MKTQEYIGKKVIVRCNRAGVFFGTLAEFDSISREATLSNVRRLWFWKGAASLSQLATDGTNEPHSCRFSVIVPEMAVMEVIEIIPCTDRAVKSINNVAVWSV